MAGAGLEAVLRITAKDEAGGALAQVKAQIAGIDKQIAVFDKMAAAVGKTAKSADPLIASIGASTKALIEQKAAAVAAAEGLDAIDGASGAAAGAQERLRAAIAETSRVMAFQGVEAVRVAEKIAAAQGRVGRAAKEARAGGVGGLVGLFAGTAALHEGKQAIEAGATLEQMKFRLRAVAGGDKTEGPFAEALAAEVAAKYPAITQAKALDTYLELRGNAANQNGTINQAIARRNLMTVAQAQTAALAIGADLTPEDAQNLLKAVEGSGRAGDPTAVGKMFDAYIRAKQVFGSAIDSSKIRDYVENAKGANFGIGEEQFFWQNIVRMTEGNASRLGNETAQTLQTLVGGHATKQTARWLVSLGLASGFTPQGGGAATIRGLVGSGLLQVNQLDWAVQNLLPALRSHGVLSEENIKQREALLRRDNPNIDERALRERAEAGLISAAVARSGMRTTVTDNLAHAIANELLIGRDVAQMRNASGSAALAASVGQNPTAALAELTGSISQFGATVASPVVQAAAPIMHSLAKAIEDASASLGAFNKAHPVAAPATYAGAGAVGAAGVGWAMWKGLTGFVGGLGRMLGLGSGAAGGAAGMEGAAAAAGSGLSRIVGAAAGAASLPGLINLLTDDNRTPAARANDAAVLNWFKHWFAGPGAPMQLPGARPAAAVGTPISPYGPTPPQNVNVTGQATVDHSVHVEVTLDPALRAKIDALTDTQEFTVPLIGGGTGRMDSDAAPHRIGIGHQ